MRTRIWIDRGGTFTDCVAVDPATGALRVAKVLSSDRAPLEGIRALLGLGPADPIPPCDIRMGTTLATNALLERRGVPTALAVTRGFADVCVIGDQRRPDLFALDIRKPRPLHARVLELDARLAASGAVLARPRRESLRQELRALVDGGARSLAVAVLHAYRDGHLEREIGQLAREEGFEHVSLSHEVSQRVGLLGRCDTTVADAYLTPLVGAYVSSLLSELPGSALRIMQSSGGLTRSDRFRGRDAVLSGPAGGAVAVAHIAAACGRPRVIGFDMGGTSTDVCRFGGELERVYECEVAGVRLEAPMVAVHTVAAGGGSLCRLDGGRLTVGPESAGAIPGPLCYGHPAAREPTLTDAALVLGRLSASRFPIPLRPERARAGVQALADALRPRGTVMTCEQVAEGLVRVAVEGMAAAIRRVSVERGHDPRDHALVVFGGAGGMFACAVARRLGIRTWLSHPLAGVLSAYGVGVAPSSWHGEVQIAGRPLDEALLQDAGALFATLEAEGRGVLTAEGARTEDLRLTRRIALRYHGTETALTLTLASPPDPAPTSRSLRARFDEEHLRELGWSRPEHAVEGVMVLVEALAHAEPPERPVAPRHPPRPPRGSAVLWDAGAPRTVPVHHREDLPAGASVRGPALVLDEASTLVVDPGFVLTVRDGGVLEVEDRGVVDDHGAQARAQGSSERDPVLLEIMSNLFMSVAEQMGAVLRRTALSTNIRDRLDFSCALFDAEGRLVANAPHIPVHLGAMGASVRAVMDAHPVLEPGDAFLTNDPSRGGTHLPDLTVVTPVHAGDGAVAFFVASRGHHADVGGTTPGSMPAFSTSLREEGLVFDSVRIARRGRLDREALMALFCAGPLPARRPRENLADLEAQLAANRRGQVLLGELVDRFGLDVVHASMRHLREDAAERVRAVITALPDAARRFEDALDDGTPVVATLRVQGARLEIDFEGTGAQVEGNLNAPRAVTMAAVLYVLRTLVGAPIALNEGCLEPVRVRIPTGSLLDPSPGRAVAGGNVETSQRVVDVLLGALGVAAASQGTMNNLSFGDAGFGYYETIGGGAGAGAGFDGASGVHTHMTNSRITDPEIIEARFPVRLRRFALRRGSGGEGRHRGGDGLVRELEALAPLRASIVSERRARAPYGLSGGGPGAPGRNLLDGRELPGKVEVELVAGSVLRIETPGGGGFGAP